MNVQHVVVRLGCGRRVRQMVAQQNSATKRNADKQNLRIALELLFILTILLLN